MQQPTAYFELNFKPNVGLVSVVRRFVTEFYQRFLSDPDGTSRVALATHEELTMGEVVDVKSDDLAAAAQHEAIAMDLRHRELMSSSCFKSFVSWNTSPWN